MTIRIRQYRRFRGARGMAPTLALALLALASWGAVREARAADPVNESEALEAAVISIEVTMQRGDWYSPWQPQRSTQSSGSGFLIGRGLVMTNAHVVSDARQIIVRRNAETTPYFAAVEFIGHDSDLALLKVEDPAFDRAIAPLELGDLPSLRSHVRTYGFPAGGDKMSRTEGVVSRIQFITYLHSGVDNHLGVQTDSAINPGNSGGPVIQDGKVVGVAFQTNTRLSGVGFFIPTPVIKRFLRDIQDGRYNGYGDLGFATSNLLNPMYRENLRLPADAQGVVVDRIVPGSSSDGAVLPDDVLLSIDGQPVRADGTIHYRGYDLSFEQIAEEKQIGEQVLLGLWRKGRRSEVSLPLRHHPTATRMRGNFDQPPAYFIHAGLVFMALDQEYLNTFGNFWQTADRYLLYTLFHKPIEHPETAGAGAVVLTRILPHPVNSAYRNLSNMVVETVNGVRIRKLADLDAGFSAGSGAFHVIQLEPQGSRIVLEREAARRSHDEILARYGISRDRRVP